MSKDLGGNIDWLWGQKLFMVSKGFPNVVTSDQRYNTHSVYYPNIFFFFFFRSECVIEPQH